MSSASESSLDVFAAPPENPPVAYAIGATPPDGPEESEVLGWEQQLAELEACRAAGEAAAAQRRAARERQEEDYNAIGLFLAFRIDGASLDGEPIYPDYDPAGWELDEDLTINRRKSDELKAAVLAALGPWTAHYASLGFVRADLANFEADGEPGDSQVCPIFYLVFEKADADLSAETLAVAKPTKLDLPGGATLELSAEVEPINATLLHDALRRGGTGSGQWGGDPRSDLAPAEAENRDDWLARVSIPRPALVRLLEQQRRSGGNINLFHAVGAASGRVAKERPINWIVSGLIPRGYVSLLVGTKQAGKSTLLGELLAVVDSECQAPRFVLGTEVTERGVSVLVSGEDGYDFVASRNAHYEAVHGEARGLVFVTAERPWTEVLRLLYEIPQGNVDIMGIDGLRAVMPGDEDSSGATSQFFDELNALAQHHDCGIVLIHHLSKGTVRSLSTMLPAVRGSGAITDRVRIAVGMIDRGAGITEVGIIKHNIPPSEPIWGEVNVGRRFRRDAATLTLIPTETPSWNTEEASSAKRDARVAIQEAVGHFNKLGQVIRRTGKHELFELRPPQLAGMSRSMIRDLVCSLIEAGAITDGPAGLQLGAGATEAPAE